MKKWLLHREILISRSLTAFWGLLALAMSFFVDDIASTVLVAINKIGSLVNGPVLGVFMLGLLTKRSNGSGACKVSCLDSLSILEMALFSS